MSELEIQEKFAVIIEILDGVKQHRKNILKYWKIAKIAANKAYQEICRK